MSHPAKSVFIFGIYELMIGCGLIIIPNTLLVIFGFHSTTEVWIRVIGVLACLFAFFDIQAARCELTDYFRWSVYTRASVILFFIAFVLSGFSNSRLILFGSVDLLGAIWTALALRKG